MMYCHCKSRKKSMKENDDGFLVICLDRRCLILSPDRPDRCGIAKQHWVLRMFLFGARCLRTPELVIKFRLVFHAMWWTWCRFSPFRYEIQWKPLQKSGSFHSFVWFISLFRNELRTRKDFQRRSIFHFLVSWKFERFMESRSALMVF